MKTKDIACAVICMDQRLLIVKQSSGVHENIWEFPGSKVESGETRGQAVARETRGELELCVGIDRCLTTIRDNREDCILPVHAYLYKCVSGEVHLHAHHEYALVTSREFYNYQLEATDQPILDMPQENAL